VVTKKGGRGWVPTMVGWVMYSTSLMSEAALMTRGVSVSSQVRWSGLSSQYS
jgi:hypothetical protein